jgi:hypothetical protein
MRPCIRRQRRGNRRQAKYENPKKERRRCEEDDAPRRQPAQAKHHDERPAALWRDGIRWRWVCDLDLCNDTSRSLELVCAGQDNRRGWAGSSPWRYDACWTPSGDDVVTRPNPHDTMIGHRQASQSEQQANMFTTTTSLCPSLCTCRQPASTWGYPISAERLRAHEFSGVGRMQIPSWY